MKYFDGSCKWQETRAETPVKCSESEMEDMDHDQSEGAEDEALDPNLWVHQMLASAFLFAVSFAGGILGLILVRCRGRGRRGTVLQ